MSPRTAAAHRSTLRRTPAPRAPRRVSGPAARPKRGPALAPRAVAARHAGGAVAMPLPSGVGRALPALPGRALAGVRGLPDSRWLDRLLHGQGWVALIAVALIGIVFVQVSMLELNSGIGRAVERGEALQRRNADLRAEVSRLSSVERIQAYALRAGLVAPPAGATRYLEARGPADARRAARVMRPPLDPAGALVAAASDPAVPAPGAPGAPAAAATAPAPAPGPTTAPQAAAPAAPPPGQTAPAPPGTTAATAPPAGAPAPAPPVPQGR